MSDFVADDVLGRCMAAGSLKKEYTAFPLNVFTSVLNCDGAAVAGRLLTASENLFVVSAGVIPGVVIGVASYGCEASLLEVIDEGVVLPIDDPMSLSCLCGSCCFTGLVVCRVEICLARYRNGSSVISSECGTLDKAKVHRLLSSASSSAEKCRRSINGDFGT